MKAGKPTQFQAWSAQLPKGRTLKDCERESGVGYTTLMRLNRGERLRDYDVAKALEIWSGGELTVDGLCEQPSKTGTED